jgi:hypothetical protein
VPTEYTDQFFTVDPGVAPAAGTPLTFARVDYIDQDDDGLIRNNSGDTFNGVAITDVWVGDTLTVNVPGVGQITYTGVTFYLASGNPVFTPIDGQVLQDGTFVRSTFVTNSTQTPVGTFGPACFTPGTMILTPDGLRAIEGLQPGDLVETLDEGAKPIFKVLSDTFAAAGNLAPIRFEMGAIDNDAPLIVSPQHRMLIQGWRAQLYFGEDEVLVAAKHLVNGDTIRAMPGGEVTYIHLLFDAHQIVFGGGVPSESCYPGHARAAPVSDVFAELQTLFPDDFSQDIAPVSLVRPELRRCEAGLLAA